MVALDASQVGVHVQLAGPGQHSALEGVGRDQSKGGGCSILAKKAPVPEEQATEPEDHAFTLQGCGYDGARLRAWD